LSSDGPKRPNEEESMQTSCCFFFLLPGFRTTVHQMETFVTSVTKVCGPPRDHVSPQLLFRGFPATMIVSKAHKLCPPPPPPKVVFPFPGVTPLENLPRFTEYSFPDFHLVRNPFRRYSRYNLLGTRMFERNMLRWTQASQPLFKDFLLKLALVLLLSFPDKHWNGSPGSTSVCLDDGRSSSRCSRLGCGERSFFRLFSCVWCIYVSFSPLD